MKAPRIPRAAGNNQRRRADPAGHRCDRTPVHVLSLIGSIMRLVHRLYLWACAVTILCTVCVAARAAPTCDWSEPGHDRFTGNLAAAVESYQDIPSAVRARLASRVDRRQYDEIVTITAGAIRGRFAYEPDLWGMHYGSGRLCMKVTRAKLQGDHFGLAYTESGYTLIVPNDCGNLARATRIESTEKRQPTAEIAPPVADQPPVAVLVPPDVSTPHSPESPLAPPEYGTPVVYLTPPPVYFGAPCCSTLPPGGPVTPVPEPSTWLLFAAGALAVWLAVRRRHH